MRCFAAEKSNGGRQNGFLKKIKKALDKCSRIDILDRPICGTAVC
jgi:hypothetical protein